MVLPIPNGKRPFWPLLIVLSLTISATYAQSLPISGRCAVSTVPTQVRAEGLTERMGDIILQCSGSNPGAVLTGNLTLFLPVSVTNRVDSNNEALDAVISVDYGTGFVPTATHGLISGNNISFNGLNLTVPANGNFNLKISNVRAAANSHGALAPQPVTASISFFISIDRPLVVIAYAQTGLYTISADRGIKCVGSPLPAAVDISSLFGAGTVFVSTRLTEGFASSFLPRGTGDDNGTRFVISYTGFPSQTQLYVPDMVAGSSALAPTRGGDLGGTASGGQYLPGSGTLLLVRVQGADSAGAGGTPIAAPSGPGAATLNSASLVPLTNGSATVVYEVADSNTSVIESAQFPTFIGLSNITAPATAQESVSFGAVSTTLTASQSAAVPRFVQTVPSSDCNILGDCAAGYFPKLSIQSQGPFTQTVFAGQATTQIPGAIEIQNGGGGVLNWTATPVYLTGSSTDWILLDQTSGQQRGTVRAWAKPQNLKPGAYTANLVIDGGPVAGSFTMPLSLTVTTPTLPPPPVVPQIKVTSVVNAATFQPTPLVAGSLGTLMGANLSGKLVTVSFDGLAAQVIYNNAGQINFVVPSNLDPAKTTVNLIVTVDGTSSDPQLVQLAPAWPAVFSNGVLNQDSSGNAPGKPAKVGEVLQIYATGIPAGATVSAQIANQANLVPLYAGPAPGIAGVQQVNLAIPQGVTSGFAGLTLCVSSGGQQYCSPGWALSIQ
jgi:uncharacterized protein (TIGR03437 family)